MIYLWTFLETFVCWKQLRLSRPWQLTSCHLTLDRKGGSFFRICRKPYPKNPFLQGHQKNPSQKLYGLLHSHSCHLTSQTSWPGLYCSLIFIMWNDWPGAFCQANAFESQQLRLLCWRSSWSLHGILFGTFCLKINITHTKNCLGHWAKTKCPKMLKQFVQVFLLLLLLFFRKTDVLPTPPKCSEKYFWDMVFPIFSKVIVMMLLISRKL